MIYFSSDHHFYHNNIIKYCNRPYSDVESMNYDLIERWNALVGKQDTVYYLGDFAFTKEQNVTMLLERLNGTKILIKGNHDPKRVSTKLGWDSIHSDLWIDVGKYKFFLCHYYDKEFNKYTKDTYYLHGHAHGTAGKGLRNNRFIDVGVDCWGYNPISVKELPIP